MSTSRKVLIVEDDESLASGMALAVKKFGYSSIITSKPEEALELIDKDKFAIVYIDCLLPQMPGVDLAKKIRKQFSPEMLPIVMMSGIFTDRNTIKEIVSETQAKDFFKKPFDISEVTKYLSKEASVVRNLFLLTGIMTLFERIYENPDQIRDMLEGLDKLSGYELPLLMTVLVEMHFSGTLMLSNSDNIEKGRIVLSKGNVIRVESSDSQSFIGRLLLSRGFVFIEDLESILKISSNKKVATRLIEENLLSPHALDEILQEQMVLRISKLIDDIEYSIDFNFDEFEQDKVFIPADCYSLMLEEWINSRVSTAWLANKFINLMEYTFKLGSNFRENHLYLKSRILENLPNLVIDLRKRNSFGNLLAIYKDRENEFYRGFYFLLCGGLVVFSEKVSQMSDDERFSRLQKMSARMNQMNLIEIFEFMGGKVGLSEFEVRGVHSEFTKRILGDHSGVSGISGFSDIYNDVKRKSDMALQLFLNPNGVKTYEQKIQAQRATDQIKAQEAVQQTKKLLSVNQYQKAIDILVTISPSLVLENRNLYLAWAKIGLMETSKTKVKDLQEVESILLQTTAEEKVSSIGNFVNALIAKMRGDYTLAKKHFEASVVLDRNFVEAKRELNSLAASSEKTPDLLKGDLKEVVNYLFKGQKKK